MTSGAELIALKASGTFFTCWPKTRIGRNESRAVRKKLIITSGES